MFKQPDITYYGLDNDMIGKLSPTQEFYNTISDVSKIINHINGVKARDEEEFLRADVNKSNTVEISDASAIVNHINGIKAVEGTL